MVVVPLAATGNGPETSAVARKSNSPEWVRIAAAGTLAASGVLLMSGKRRAGLVTAATGMTLAVIDQKETVSVWWNRVPGFLEEVQGILSRVQSAVNELSMQGERLHRVLSK